MQSFHVFTDGACEPNPGRGGWGYVIRQEGRRNVERSGGERHTTNNRMEMMGAIVALESLPRPCLVLMVTDSQYLLKGASQWLPNWKRRGWRTKGKNGGDVKNRDLWERLDAAMQGRKVSWQWVRGHSGHVENERADRLAARGRKDCWGVAPPTPTQGATRAPLETALRRSWPIAA